MHVENEQHYLAHLWPFPLHIVENPTMNLVTHPAAFDRPSTKTDDQYDANGKSDATLLCSITTDKRVRVCACMCVCVCARGVCS